MTQMRLISALTAIAALALVSCANMPKLAAPEQSVAPKLIWSGEGDGFRIRWTTGDIIASPARASSSSQHALSELAKTVAEFHLMARKQGTDCDLTRVATLQSVVGPILSIQSLDKMKCMSGAEAIVRKMTAVDLTRPNMPLALGALFPAHELDALKTKSSHFCSSLPPDLMKGFAFSELHRDVAIVTITLPANCSSARVNLALNVPTTLRHSLQLAAQRKDGFLLQSLPVISRGAVTTISYHYRTSVEP